MNQSIDELYPEAEIKDAICKQVSMLKIAGVSRTAAAKKLGISIKKLDVIWESHEVSFFSNKIVEETVRDFRTVLIKEVATLVPLLVETIKFHLEQKNLNAVPHTLKILGFDKEQTEQSQQITVVMPDFTKQATITTTYEKKEDETLTAPNAQKAISSHNSDVEIDVSLPKY